MQQECCTFNMGKRVDAFLNELEAWCSLATEEVKVHLPILVTKQLSLLIAILNAVCRVFMG